MLCIGVGFDSFVEFSYILEVLAHPLFEVLLGLPYVLHTSFFTGVFIHYHVSSTHVVVTTSFGFVAMAITFSIHKNF